MKKRSFAPCKDERLGGKLAHNIVMRYEGMQTINHFVDDILLDRRGKSDGDGTPEID